jgi:peptide/nickel transport system substrate-binding protein
MTHTVRFRLAAVTSLVVALALVGVTLDAEAQKKGGIIRVGILGEPPALDAHWTTASITETLTNHIYEGLYTLDENYRPIPMLAGACRPCRRTA